MTPGCQFTLTSSPTNGVTPVITGNVAVYSGVPAGTYTITLQSISGGLTSVSSVSTTFVVSLAAPTSFSAKSLGSKITLNWAESTAGASFNLSCTNNSAFGTQTISAGTFTTSYGNVSTPGIYTFSIVSVLPGNNVSAPVTVSGQIVSTPASFTAVSTGSTINLSWTQATAGSTFSLSSSPGVPNLSITGNTATSTGVTAGVYTFNLSAFTSGGSFLSTIISARTQVISTPTAFTAAFVAPNVTLSWAEATPNCTFTLSSSPALTNPAPSTALTAQYSSPLPGNYTFYVTAADGSGNTSSSASTSQTVTPPSPSNLAYTPVSPTAFTITFSEALANCTFGFTSVPAVVGSVAVTGTAGSYSAAFTGVTPSSAQSFTITVNSSYGGILSTGNSSIVARTKPNTTFSSNALCTVVGGQNTVSAQYIINNPDMVTLRGPGTFLVTTSYTVNMLYSGTTTTPGVSATSTNSAGVYYTDWYGGGYGITVPSAFPDFILPPAIGTVTANGTTITVPWTDSTTGSLTYAILNSTLSATGIAAGTQTRSFTNAVVGTAYSFTITTVSGYVTANSATSTAITPISTPTNLSAVATGTTVNMSWSYSYGSLTGITFNVLDQNGNTRGTTGLGATNTSFTVSDSTAYTFTVKAIAQGGNATATSAGISVTTVPVPSITSVLENGATITITCGTPTSGTLSIAQTSGTTLTAGNTTNPFTYTGAASNTTYGFTVTNTGTRSTNTSVSNITTMGQPTFTKSDASGQSVILQWSYPTGAPAVTSYSVFPSGSTTAVVTGLTSLSYTFVPSSGTPPLVYNVVAIGGVGTGIASLPTDNITPLTAVTIGNPGATSTDGTNVTVVWTYPITSTSGVTFKVYDPTLTTLYSSYSYSAVSPNYSTVFSTSLTRNSTYSFVVLTTDPQGDTAVSGSTCNVTLLTAPVVKTVNQTGGQILVTLSAQPAITPAPYTPYYTIPLISPASLALTASTATTFTYSGAAAATTYTFTIQNNAGAGAPNSTNSTTQSFTTLSTPVPGSITYIPASTSVSASWTYGGTVAGTQFILKNADGSQFGTVTGVTSANISATIGTTYTLTITASSGGNVSFPSTAFSAVTAAIPFTISSFAQNGTRLVATVSGSATSASTVPSLGVPAVSGTAAFLGSPILWLDGADPAGNSTFPGTVTTWVDKSGLGNNATSQSGSIIVTGSGLSFDGASKYLTIPGIAGSLSGTPFVVFAVETYTGGSSSNTFYFGDDANIQVTDSVLNIGYRKGVSAGGTGAYTFGFWNNDLNDTNVNITTTGVTRIWTNYLPGSSSRTIRRNGAVDATYTTANQLKAFTTPVIGRAFTGSYYTGIISEILVYKTDIGLPAIQTIEYYLSQKWGVPGPAAVPYGYTGSPITFTFKGASANTNYLVNILGSGLTVSAALTTLFTPGAPTLTATTGTSVYASSTYNGVTNPAGITLNYYNSVGNTNLGSSFVATASQSYTLYATATSGLNTSISSANSAAIIPIGPITYTKVPTTGGGVAITCAAAGATSFSGTSPGLTATVNANVITFAVPPLSGIYYIITITATNATGATNSITITEKTSFAPASIPGLSMWYDAADTTTIGYRSVTTPTVANLQFWLDFADTTNLSAPGGNLTQINDKSGNNYTATAASTVDYSATTKLLHFHNGQYLNLPQASINAAPVWSMFMVIQPVSLTQSWIMAKQRDGANSPTIFGIGGYSSWSGFSAATTPGMFTYKSTNVAQGTTDHLEAAVLTTSLQVLSMTYDAANFRFYVNGTLRNTIAGSWPIINETSANSFTMGRWLGGATNQTITDIYMGELQFYNTDLTETNRQLVEGFLAWKWALQTSLPTAHPYSPTKVTTGPAFTSTFSTTEVASWRDKSENGLNLTYPGGSYSTYSATGFNGQYPGINFNANSYLQTANFLPTPILSSNGTDTTVFIVYNDLNTNGYYGVFSLDSGDALYALLSPYSTNQHYFGFGGSWVFNNINFTVTPGPQLYSITKQGSASRWYNFGGTVTNGSSSTAATITSTSQKFNVGRRTAATPQVFNSFISEILIYNYALNTTQRQQIEGYLAWKWGLQNALSTDNPYNGPGGVKPPSYVGPLSSGPIEWIDATDTNTMTFTLNPSELMLPLNIPQIAMWFDAYDSTQVTLQSGTANVTGWKDKSGNGRNTTLIGSGTAPTYSATGFNGNPGIQFNSGQYLATQTFTNLGSVLSSNSTDTTIFVVFNDLNIAAMGNCVYGTNLADTQYRLLRNVNPGTTSKNWFGFGASDVITDYFYTPSIAPQLYSFVKTPTSASFYTYGNFQVTCNTVNAIDTAPQNKRFTIGGNESSYNPYNSYISEVIVYNYALNPTQRQQVEGYLAWKWGLEARLPPGHLASVNPPALYTGPLSSGPIMWYDATDSSTITFEISDVSGLVFLPSTLPQLAMWFDAHDAITVTTTDGTTVTGWKDKSGNGRNTSNISNVGGGTAAATYSSNGFIVNGQGYPGIKFNSGQYLATQTFTNLGSVLSSNSTDTTIFVVFNDLNIAAMGNCVYGTNLADTQYRLLRNVNPGTTSKNWFGFGASDVITDYFYTPSIAPQLYSFVKTPTSASFYTYGNFQVTCNTVNAIDTAPQNKRFTIGGNESSYGIYNSYISELIIYNYALNPTQRQQVEGYLAWTWGLQGRLPPGHLALNSPPQAYYGALSAGPIMWYDAADSSTMTFEISDVSGLTFLPSSLSQLAMWFDAYDADTVITTDGVTVKGWEDKSGNGRNTSNISNVVGVTASAATYSSNGFIINGQGYPGIKFNSGQYLATQTFPNLGSVLSSNSTDTTIFVVFNDLNTPGMCNCVYGTNLGDTQYRLLRNVNPGTTSKNWFGFGASDVITDYFYTPSIAPQLYSFVKTPTSASFYTYGNFQVTCNTVNAIDTAPQNKRFNIGGNESSYNPYNSYISEVIVYNRALTTNERQQVEGYLAWTWGLQTRLPPGHPGLTNPPFPFTSPLSVGAIAWYDASDATTVQLPAVNIPLPQVWFDGRDPAGNGTIPANGASVFTWVNKGSGGSSYNALQAFGYSAATYSTACNALNFTTTTTAYSTGYPANPTAETMFVVANNPSPSSGNNVVIGGQFGARALGWGYSPLGYISYLNNERNWLATASGGYTSGTTALITGQVNGTNLSITQNGGLTPRTSTTGDGFVFGTTTFLGTDTGNKGTYYYIGYQMEVLFYNSVLTVSQYQQVEGYLAWKWGIQVNLPPTHPYKTTAPSWTPASVGGGGSIQRWNDKSGRGYNLSLGSGIVTYGNTALGPSINLSGGYMFSTSLANLQNYALFTVLGSPTAVYNQAVITGRPNNTASYNSTDGFGLYVDSSGTSQLRLYGNPTAGGSNINTVPGTGTNTTAPIVVNNISQYISATPGTYTISSDANYTYYKFTQTSTLTISSVVTAVPIYYFAVGGGGGGGPASYTLGGGGGGAGGLQTNISQAGLFVPPSARHYVPGGALTLSGANQYGISIGTGGPNSTSGTATTFSGPGITTITAGAGGAGGSAAVVGVSGGCGGGGGGAQSGTTCAGGTGTQGFDGGTGVSDLGGSFGMPGGGGGLGGVGSNAQVYRVSGNGGPAISFLGMSFGGGGGGGGGGSGIGGWGVGGGAGAGAGGDGSSSGGNATLPNTGSGGGGGGYYGGVPDSARAGGTGATGVFILVVPNSGTVALPTVALNPVIASYTGAANGVISSWINGSAGTITTTGVNRTISGQGFAIGAEWTGSAYTNLSAVTSLYEIVVMSNVPSTIQRQQMEGYLAWKWGLQANLPASHPYKTYTPVGPVPSYTTTNIMNVADKSGYGNFLTSNSISYPTYVSSAKGIYFGPDAALSNNFVKIPTGYSMFAVTSLSYSSDYSRLVNISMAIYNGVIGTGPGATFGAIIGNGASWNNGTPALTPSTAISTYPTQCIVELTFSGGNVYAPYFNGNVMSTLSSVGQITGTGINFGLLPGATGIWPGFLHEFLLVSQQLQPLQRQQLEGYLAWKWNLSSQLPTGHLFKNASPIQATTSSQIVPSFRTSNVMNWKDKSGYENFLTSNSISYPTYVSSAKGVYFGPDAALSNPFVKIPAGYTMFAIASLSSSPTNYGRLANIGTADYNGFMGTFSTTSQFITFTGTGSAWNDTSANTPVSNVSTYPALTLLEMDPRGNVLTPFINGTTMTTKSSANQPASVTGINFGLLPSAAGQIWPGYLHEFLLVSQLLTPIQRQQMEGYLAWKWNISSQLPTGHPFRFSSPTQGYIPSSNVKALNDKSGFGNNFSLASPITNYPQYSSTYKGIYLGISASFLNTTLSVPAGYTMMAVASLSTTPGSYGRLINVGQGDGVGFLGTYSQTISFATFTGNGVNWNDVSANTPATPVSTNPVLPSIMEMTVCGTVLNPFFNAADMSAKVGTTVAATGMIIGATANNGGQFWPGYLNEFLLVPRTLTILQRQQLEGYLAWKWGLQGNLPSTHPFKLGPP